MRYFIPLIIFFAIIGFLYKGLKNDPHQLSSTLINKPVTTFSYPSLIYPNQKFTEQKFLGHVSLLNVWGTWCVTCHAEHSVLMDIARSKKVTIYGLNYKDDPIAAKQWLKKQGNPYEDIILDDKGTLAIDFGVYGTPETFVIDKKGIIRYKHVGAISRDTWENKIKPEVNKWNTKP